MKLILKRLSFLVLLLAITNMSSARSWHINNNVDAPAADFASINEAMGSADVVAGDTLYLGNGCILGTQSISKKVTVIGGGIANDNSPVVIPKINGTLYIEASGAKIIGVYVNGDICINKGNIENIEIERCYGVRFRTNKSGINNVRLIQSRCAQIDLQFTDWNSGWVIKNCIFICDYPMMKHLNKATIENNVFINIEAYNITSSEITILEDVVNSTIKNNIMIQKKAGGEKYFFQTCNMNVVSNNVFSLPVSYESSYPGNTFLESNDEAVVFKCTGSKESGEYYSLKEGSPAIGAGEGGIDCGVMAGAYKYVPFCRPINIPIIREASVPATTTDGKVRVTLKLENQNE